MAIKQKPKNRKKAYKPKKPNFVSNSIEHAALIGFEGMAKHLSTLPPPKKHLLEMSWDLKNTELNIDLYCLMHGIQLSKKGLMPLNVLQAAYQGDLIIALRENLIPEKQNFKITITSKAKRLDDPSVVVPVKPYSADFNENPIDYAVFMLGPKRGKHYHKRKSGFKTIWQGLTEEWKTDLDEQYSDEYEIYDSQATLSCETYFSSQICESIFKKLKAKRQLREAA